MNIQVLKNRNECSNELQSELVDFLFHHLGKYGDEKRDIAACMDYAMNPDKGGYVVIAEEELLLGVVIVNKTGMSRFIPENILVYIAVHERARGKGVGAKLMQTALDAAEGDVALHVEPDNPAKKLYERLGFTNKYLEMRWKR